MQSAGQVEADRPVATFSKVKFRLQNLVTELNRLRDREKATQSEVKRLLQKQKLLEADRAKEQTKYEAELTAVTKGRREFEAMAKELRTSLIAAELREQTFKRELTALLQSRSNVTEHLKVENHRLRLSLQARSRELGEALDVLRRHGQLVEAVEREFISLKRLVHEAHQIVREKEDNVARLEAKLGTVTCEDNKLELLEKLRSLQKQLDDSCKCQLAKDMAIKTLELKLESGRSVDTLKEELSFARQVNKLKDSTISRFQRKIQTLEIQICAMEIVVGKSQERLKRQEDLLESNRRELLETQDTARHLQASLQEVGHQLLKDSIFAGKNLTNYAEACEKLESSTSQELRRSAELQAQLESIIQRYNSLETQQRNYSGLAEAVSVNDKDTRGIPEKNLKMLLDTANPEKRSLSTSTSDLITIRDKSTCTRDLQGEPGEGEDDDLARDDLPNTYLRRPFQTEKTNAKKKPPDIAEQSKCKKYKMKAKRDHIRDHSKRNPCPDKNSDSPISIEDLVIVARENDQVNLEGATVTAKTNQVLYFKSCPGELQQACYQERKEDSTVEGRETTSLNQDTIISAQRTCNGNTVSALPRAHSILSTEKGRVDKTASGQVTSKDAPAWTSTIYEGGGTDCDRAVMRESDAARGDESCVSIVNHSTQQEGPDYINYPERLARAPSPDLEFDVEILLKQDLFPDVISSGRENNEWVYTDTEAGVTFTEDVHVPALDAEFTLQSCPDSQEKATKKRRQATTSEDTAALDPHETPFQETKQM